MTLIQVILSAGLIFIAMYMYVRLRTSLIDVLLIFAFMLGGILLVLFPDTTSKIAHWAGVGRGVDLVFYLGFLFLFFVILKLYARIRRLEQHLTKEVREETINQSSVSNPQSEE